MAKFAVIKTGGKQYKVKEGARFQIEKIDTLEGKSVIFSDVLLVADTSGKDFQLGNPMLKGAKVEAIVEKQFKDKKITVIKYKAKTRYKRKLGHRQRLTAIKITKIS